MNLNSICQNCVADCEGTTCQVWTGCIYRKIVQPDSPLYEIARDLQMLTVYEDITSHAEADYEANPEDSDAEARFDRAYQKEFNTYQRVINRIAEILDIEQGTARRMVLTQRDEILRILSRKEA